MGKNLYPPGPIGKYFGGGGFQSDPLAYLTKVARDYGDLAHFQIGRQHVYLLSHPDYIKDVLVTNQANFLKARAPSTQSLLGEGLLTSEGNLHRRQRRLSQPAFHRARIAAYGDVIVEHGVRLRDLWRDGQTLDISNEMMKLTLQVVGKVLFDVDVGPSTEEIGSALAQIRELFQMPRLRHSRGVEQLRFVPAARRFRGARARLDRIIYRIIRERRQSKVEQGDLISMLLFAQDEDGSRMSDKQARDEVITLLLAGHETTSNALTWTWYLLSQHPEAESKLHAELDRQLPSRMPSFDDFGRLTYTEMVFAEVLRLYPPAWRIGRRVIADYDIGGYVIPSGSLVLLSQYVVHRDPRFFPDPLRFDPERWRAESREALPQFAYFPFGGGSRRCIGEGFARTVGVLLLATLASNWRVRVAAGHQAEMQPLLTLRPKNPMPVTLYRRN